MIHNVDPQLSQWDVGRSISVSETNATHAHFANQGDSKAAVVDIIDGEAKIPDHLLWTGKTVVAYLVLTESQHPYGVTLESKSFPVRKRERPENYVYEDDRRNYIYKLITDAQAATAGANLATQNANEAAGRATQAAKSWVINGEAGGESIYVDDAIEQPFAGLRIFGKTTQDGTPTPDVPVELVSVGDSGSITVNVTGENDAQSMTIATPNGLPGIQVESGGNYTDANGQQWVCDEKDFARGVYVQRVGKYSYTGKENWGVSQVQNTVLTAAGLVRYDTGTSQYPKAGAAEVLSSHCLFVGANKYDETCGMATWVSEGASYLALRIVVGIDTVDELKTWLA